VAVFGGLGIWQLRRADATRAYFAAFEAPPGTQILAGAVDDSQAAAQPFAHVRLRGRYDGAKQVLLDARVRRGLNGYEVLTPLQTADGAVLINRGWVPAPALREVLPEIAVSDAEREITGRIARLPVPGLRSSAPATANAGWPRRLLFPTAQEISRAVGYRVHDYQVLLAAAEPEGFLRDWRPSVMSPEQHLGYALQWFALALAVIIVFVTLNFRRGSHQ
jgi:surfeit locus 1 family protein